MEDQKRRNCPFFKSDRKNIEGGRAGQKIQNKEAKSSLPEERFRSGRIGGDRHQVRA